MSAFCGWLSRDPLDIEGAKALVVELLRRVDDGASRPDSIVTGRTSALGAAGVESSCATIQSGIHAAISGRAFWDAPELQRIADQRGLAASIAEGYRRWGSDFLQRLHGVFALAAVDPDRERVLLAIDRLGVGTLCYAAPPSGFVFSSRADATALHPWLRSDIDLQGVFNYLFFHVVPAPGTIFQGVKKLLPAQYVHYERGQLTTGFYWRLEYRDRAQGSNAELSRRFRTLLPVVVQRACGNQTVATFLSGGTDSSTLTGILAQVRNSSQVHAYSIGFAADGFDEISYARIAATHFNVCHHTYYVTPDHVLEAIPVVARAYDEPFGNASAVPTYYCARLAKSDGVEVMLAGDGGDEIFGGNARYAKQKLFEAYGLIPKPVRTELLEPLLAIPAFGRVPGARKALSYVRQARVPLPDRLESYNFLIRESLDEVLDPDFLAGVSTTQPLDLMREVYERTASGSAVNRMMHLDLKQTLADNDLRKVTRMCGLAGIDVRYPLLDEEMVEFSGLVPPSAKVKGVRLRHFFKESLKDLLPRETIAKTKHGFGLPFGLWLSQHPALHELACDSLTSLKRRKFLRSAYIDSLLASHRSDDASYYGVMIWVLIMLEQWLASGPASSPLGRQASPRPRVESSDRV